MASWFLSTVNPWLILLSLALTLIGVLGLYYAWAQPQRYWPLLGLSWGALLFAHWPWMEAIGWDRGLVMLSLSVGLIALLTILLRTPWHLWGREGRKRPLHDQPPKAAKPIWKGSGHLAKQILVVGVLSFCAALGIALVLFALIETSTVNRTVFASLFILMLWPILMVWSQSKNSLLKPALYFVGISLCGWLFTPAFF